MDNSQPIGPAQAKNSQEEFEKLLSLAESLHEKCESEQRRVFLYRALQFVLGALFAIAGAFLGFRYFLQEHTTFERMVVLVSSLAVAFVLVYMMESIARPISRRIHSDQKAVERLLQLIRETKGATAKTEGWSALEKAQFEIRLSRLEIAP